jgi:DNA-binding NarL/FixJ family response regulator
VNDRPRVLIVDDDPSMRLLLRAALGADGGCVVVGESSDADGAITFAEAQRPDVIVLDHMMPGTTGLDAAPALRHAAPGSRIVVFSAVADRLARVDAPDVDAFIVKGGHINDTVREILDLR